MKQETREKLSELGELLEEDDDIEVVGTNAVEIMGKDKRTDEVEPEAAKLELTCLLIYEEDSTNDFRVQ